MTDELNPFELDRTLKETAERSRKWLRRLRQAEGLDEDPFLFTRWACGKTTFDRVENLPADDPLREPLRRWVYHLADLRINHLALCHVTAELRVVERVVEQPERMRVALAELLARALADGPRRSDWLGAFQSGAQPLASAVQLLWERRGEIARRMRVPSLDSIEAPAENLDAVAERWLTDTDDAFSSLRCRTLADVLDRALAVEANEGWPGHLLPRTLVELFDQPDLFRSLDLDMGPLPPAVAAASFMRALSRLGSAWVDAAAPRDQPFVIANDPYGLRRRTLSALFGALPFNPEFSRRSLAVAPAGRIDHRRAIAEALLVASRLAAVRWLLRRHALAGADAFRSGFESLTARALPEPLPPSVAGALLRLRPDAGQRLAGVFLAAVEDERLTEAHDTDWYRNPRGVDQLRAEAALSPETRAPSEKLEAGASLLLNRLTEAL